MFTLSLSLTMDLSLTEKGGKKDPQKFKHSETTRTSNRNESFLFQCEEKSELRPPPGLGILEFICDFQALIRSLTKKLLPSTNDTFSSRDFRENK
ncbi:hypothetical protein AVEN_3899-1 [Araneus ventricosus]|uniref:Uncharacterized protein n=1 Tax=Araneus ventricosus TaxID=182803 RepID=A0A4Y2J733_ARAVE|nr:hypothetical protein AVEN_3899-1 [Araneus ventricosus]